MVEKYWQRQSKEQPLFPDLLWSRPENKQTAGKLLVIGGNAHGFAAPAEAYAEAVSAGVGSARVVMPFAVKAIAGKLLDTVEYAASTSSGSFSQKALGELLEQARWADGILFAGDLGRNSETAIVVEKFIAKYSGQLTFTKDASDYAVGLAKTVVARPPTLLVLTIAQLQKLCQGISWPEPITFSMDLVRLVDTLHHITQMYPVTLLVKHLDHYIVASDGRVCTSPSPADPEELWRVKTAAHASVWWLQNPSVGQDAITTSLLETRNN